RPAGPFDEYLAFHNEVDVLLDTFPFNGHTTLCHALWMGVPAVTLAGQTFASRLGLSVLTNVDLLQLIASTPQEYERIAITLVNDLSGLSELRRTMRERMRSSPLLDAVGFASDFETAVDEMCLIASAGDSTPIA